tara:strand:+ start:368 stop:535 length:168 start_codon:yes stop_codon:yes gene_type:complete
MNGVMAGTDPGTLAAAMNPMMPIIARRPLLISRSSPARQNWERRIALTMGREEWL